MLYLLVMRAKFFIRTFSRSLILCYSTNEVYIQIITNIEELYHNKLTVILHNRHHHPSLYLCPTAGHRHSLVRAHCGFGTSHTPLKYFVGCAHGVLHKLKNISHSSYKLLRVLRLRICCSNKNIKYLTNFTRF